MTRRTRLLFFALGVIALAAALWIALNIRNGTLSSTDDTVEVVLIPATDA